MVETPTRPPEKFVRGETDTLDRVVLLDWVNAGVDEQNAVAGAIAISLRRGGFSLMTNRLVGRLGQSLTRVVKGNEVSNRKALC